MLMRNPKLDDLAAQARQGLRDAFGGEAVHTAAAPGRVNLIGEHIDYCDGFVMPLAIERHVVAAARPNGTKVARIATSQSDERAGIDLSVPVDPAEPKWSNYIRGVLRAILDRGDGEIPGFDAYLVSSVPTGAGLSSSAALECCAATLAAALAGITIPKKELALLCQWAEHNFAGVPCGIMDQFASTFGEEGRLVFIDCRSAEPTLVPFTDPTLGILVSNTKVSHELSDGGYALRRRQTEEGLAIIGKASWRDVTPDDLAAAEGAMDPVVFRRARHVVGEIARTVEAARALEQGEIEKLGPLMAASHQSLRDDFNVSCEELDLLVDAAAEPGPAGGVIGARMTGGGFGGSTVTLCRLDQAAAIAGHLAARYTAAFGFAPEIFLTRPATGAHLVG